MTFTWWGTELNLFDHPYNDTIDNERAVEIPIAHTWLTGRELVAGVEIGNVLNHYGHPSHRVVDLYETARGVDNIDVFDLGGHFQWILAISTIEHVGERDHDRSAPIEAIEHLRSLLAPGGEMLVTIPGGYHPTLDRYLADGAGTTRAATLVRSSQGWQQTADLQFLPYGPRAQSVWIGEWV